MTLDFVIKKATVVKNGKEIIVERVRPGILSIIFPFCRTTDEIVCYIPHAGPEIRIKLPRGRFGQDGEITEEVYDAMLQAVKKLAMDTQDDAE